MSSAAPPEEPEPEPQQARAASDASRTAPVLESTGHGSTRPEYQTVRVKAPVDAKVDLMVRSRCPARCLRSPPALLPRCPALLPTSPHGTQRRLLLSLRGVD